MKRVLVVMTAAVALASCSSDRGSDERQESDLRCAHGFSVVQCCKRKFPSGKDKGQCVAEGVRGRGVCAHPHAGAGGGGSGGGGTGGAGGLPDAGDGSVGGTGGSADAGTDTGGDSAVDTGADAAPSDAGSDTPEPPVNHCPTVTITKSPERVAVGGTLTVTVTIFEPDPNDTPNVYWQTSWPPDVTATPFSYAPAPFSNPVPIPDATVTATVTCLNPTAGAELGLLVLDNLPPRGCPVSVSTEVCAPWCGDGRTTAPEECDPPNGSTCDDQCRRINGTCGDGVIQSGESCEVPQPFCQNCQLTTCGGCFYAVGGGSGVCAGLSSEDTISCYKLVSCTSPGLTRCAFQTGPNVAPGILGCYCSDATCTAPGPCGAWFEALAHSHDPAEVIRQINDPTTPVGHAAAAMLRFGNSSCGRSCVGS